MSEKLKFVEAILFNQNNNGNKHVLVPVEAIACLEKHPAGDSYIVHFKPDYNFGTKEPIKEINARVTSKSVEILM